MPIFKPSEGLFFLGCVFLAPAFLGALRAFYVRLSACFLLLPMSTPGGYPPQPQAGGSAVSSREK